ncbi:MAG: HD domain-containing protein [Sulfurimonas sp.]|nr:HD domain-containing protein [Sulfurimonas sp.]
MRIIQSKIKYSTLYTPLEVKSLEVGYGVPCNILIKKEDDYVIVIERGTILTQRLYQMLERQEVLYVTKQNGGNDKISAVTLLVYIKANINYTDKTLELINRVNSEIFDSYLRDEANTIDIASLSQVVLSVIFLMKNSPEYLKNVMALFPKEYNLAYNSLHVMLYAVHLGNILKMDSTQLLQLGTAALLRDIGTKKVLTSIMTKESGLTTEEFKSMQKHTTLSLKIAQQNALYDTNIIDIIMHHHECQDGSGYPKGLHGSEISQLASVLGICDVFDALTNDRPHRKKYSYYEALKLMMKDVTMAPKFDQEQLKLFLHSLL